MSHGSLVRPVHDGTNPAAVGVASRICTATIPPISQVLQVRLKLFSLYILENYHLLRGKNYKPT
jgi:hypothetical protein